MEVLEKVVKKSIDADRSKGKKEVSEKVGNKEIEEDGGKGKIVVSKKPGNKESEEHGDVGKRGTVVGSEGSIRSGDLGGPVARCSTQIFISVMKGIDDRITVDQRAAMMRTPFAHILQCPKGYSSVVWLEALVGCFDKDLGEFVFGEKLQLKFPSSEFSCNLGLQHVGLYVHPKLVEDSLTVKRYFERNAKNIKRSDIIRCWKRRLEMRSMNLENAILPISLVCSFCSSLARFYFLHPTYICRHI